MTTKYLGKSYRRKKDGKIYKVIAEGTLKRTYKVVLERQTGLFTSKLNLKEKDFLMNFEEI